MYWQHRNKINTFSAISEETLTGSSGESFETGSSFTYTSADTTVSVKDNDRRLDGDSWRNERGNDRQKGSIETAQGTVIAGNMYAEKVHLLLGSDGRYYYLVEIEGTRLSNDESNDDIFTFYGRTPPTSTTLTAVRDFNVHFGLHYGCLGAGDVVTSVPSQAINDVITISEDADGTLVLANVLGNDESGTAETLVVSALNGETVVIGAFVDLDDGGRVLVAADGSVQFDAGGDFDELTAGEVRTITLSYTISDDQGGSSTANITLNITGTNDGPTLAAASAAAVEDGAAISIDLAALGGDVDSDDDGTTLTYAITGAPSGGTAAITGTDFSFDPGSDFQELALDETLDVVIQITATDSHGASAVNDVTVTVTGTNDAPTITVATLAATEDGGVFSVDLAPFASDVDSDNDATNLSYAIPGGPSEGTAVFNGSVFEFNTGSAFQDLAEGETRDVVVNSSVTDVHGAPDTSTVTVTVTGTNDGPTLAVAAVDAAEDGAAVFVDLSTLGDDLDAEDDGTTLTYTISSAPTEGSAEITGTTLSFDPSNDFQELGLGETRDVVVQVTATDAQGATATSDITVTITGTNDGPVALADVNDPTAEVGEDNLISGSVADNDTDADVNSSLTYTLISPLAGLTLLADGTYTFDTGDAAYSGSVTGDTLTAEAVYMVTDDQGATDEATLTITFTPPNAAPNFDGDTTLDSAVTGTGATVAYANDLSGLFSDPDGDVLSFSATGLPAGFTLSAAGVLTQTDTASLAAAGDYTISVTATDPFGAAVTQDVTITVAVANDFGRKFGEQGAETVDGSAGADNLTFGDFAGDDGSVIVNSGDGGDTITFAADAGGNEGSASVTSGSGADTLSFGDYSAGFFGAVDVRSGAGNDIIEFADAAGADSGTVYVGAGLGADTITFGEDAGISFSSRPADGTITIDLGDDDDADTLTFGAGVTNAFILNFDPTDGDTIEIQTATTWTGEVVDGNTVFTSAEGEVVTFVGISDAGVDPINFFTIPQNLAPTYIGDPDLEFASGTTGAVAPPATDISILFSDADGDALSFTATGLPSNFSLSTDGILTQENIYSAITVGDYSFTITATDTSGASVSVDLDLSMRLDHDFGDFFFLNSYEPYHVHAFFPERELTELELQALQNLEFTEPELQALRDYVEIDYLEWPAVGSNLDDTFTFGVGAAPGQWEFTPVYDPSIMVQMQSVAYYVVGGEGNDTVTFGNEPTNWGAEIIVEGGSGDDFISFGAFSTGDLGDVTGGKLIGHGGTGNDTIEILDVVAAESGLELDFGIEVYALGGEGNDVITIGGIRDHFQSMLVSGGAGADVISLTFDSPEFVLSEYHESDREYGTDGVGKTPRSVGHEPIIDLGADDGAADILNLTYNGAGTTFAQGTGTDFSGYEWGTSAPMNTTILNWNADDGDVVNIDGFENATGQIVDGDTVFTGTDAFGGAMTITFEGVSDMGTDASTFFGVPADTDTMIFSAFADDTLKVSSDDAFIFAMKGQGAHSEDGDYENQLSDVSGNEELVFADPDAGDFLL